MTEKVMKMKNEKKLNGGVIFIDLQMLVLAEPRREDISVVLNVSKLNASPRSDGQYNARKKCDRYKHGTDRVICVFRVIGV